jgi:hypothetical protein
MEGLRKQIGSSLGVVTSTNSVPRWEAQNGRSGVDLRKLTGSSLGERETSFDRGESLRLTQSLRCLDS